MEMLQYCIAILSTQEAENWFYSNFIKMGVDYEIVLPSRLSYYYIILTYE